MSAIADSGCSIPALAWRRFVFALAFSVAALAALWMAIPPVYLTNDDVTIRLSVEGRLVPGQPPAGFALMTHAVLGWLVAWAGTLLPSIPFWDLAVVGVLVWAVALIAALCYPLLGTDALDRTIALAAISAVVMPLVATVQFTFGATVAGGAAVILAFLELGASRRPRAAALAAAAALAVFGLLVRPMAAAAGAATAGIFLMPVAFGTRRVVHVAAVACTAIATFAALQWLDTVLYAIEPGWDRYHRYNWMTAALFEWAGRLSSREIESIRTSAGWSENDWALLAGWFGVDPNVHGYERVATAYGAFAGSRWNALAASLQARVMIVGWSGPVRILSETAPALVVIGGVALAYTSRRSARWLASMLVLYVVACVGIEVVFKGIPFRLLAPLQVCLVTAALVSLAVDRRPTTPFARVVALSLVATIGVHRTVQTVQQLRAEEDNAAQIDEQVRAVEELRPSLVVLHGDSFPSEVWWRPFQPSSSRLTTIRLGDNNQNPLLQRFLTETGRQPLVRAACDDPSILIVSAEGRLDPTVEYMREHFHVPVRWQLVYRKSFSVWRCERVAASSQAADTTTPDALKRNSQ